MSAADSFEIQKYVGSQSFHFYSTQPHVLDPKPASYEKHYAKENKIVVCRRLALTTGRAPAILSPAHR